LPPPLCAALALWNILTCMVSRSFLAACSLAAVVGASSLAQSAPSQPQNPAPVPSAPAPAQPTLQLHDLPPEPHTPTPAEIEQRRQQQLLNAAVRLATMQAHWGPDMNSPGLSLTLTERSRTKTPDGTRITYQVTGTGFSPDDNLALVRWPLNAEARPVMTGIHFNAQGVAVCGETAPAQPAPAPSTPPASGASPQAPAPPSGLTAAPAPQPGSAPQVASPTQAFASTPGCWQTMQQQQPVEIQTTAAAGEAIRIAVMSADRKHGAAASSIPFPIASTDKGCSLQVIIGMKDAGLVLIDGSGFPPNTPLTLDATTGDNLRPLHPRANAEGRIVVPLLTGAKGQASGDTTIRFAGLNRQPTLDTPKDDAQPAPDCAPAVTFHWGDGTYKIE
jgi:hypothetical protein